MRGLLREGGLFIMVCLYSLFIRAGGGWWLRFFGVLGLILSCMLVFIVWFLEGVVLLRVRLNGLCRVVWNVEFGFS